MENALVCVGEGGPEPIPPTQRVFLGNCIAQNIEERGPEPIPFAQYENQHQVVKTGGILEGENACPGFSPGSGNGENPEIHFVDPKRSYAPVAVCNGAPPGGLIKFPAGVGSTPTGVGNAGDLGPGHNGVGGEVPMLLPRPSFLGSPNLPGPNPFYPLPGRPRARQKSLCHS